MSKPEFITDEEIAQLDLKINQPGWLPPGFESQESLKNLFRSGLWLSQELERTGCRPVLVFQFQTTHGEMSFGHDPWEVAKQLLDEYLNNTYTIAEN